MPRAFVQSFFNMHAPRQPHAVIYQLSASFFGFVFLFIYFSLKTSLFPSTFVPLLLRSERMMAELSMIGGWVRFRPLYRRRYLGDLIMRYVGHSSISV